MTDQHVPILVYHHVYPEGAAELTGTTHETGAGIIGEAEFRRQLRFILDEGWTIVSTTRIVDWLVGEGTLPSRSTALHFDNGWVDTATIALPTLRELGVTATCFPITDGVEAATRGRSATMRTLTEGVVEKPFMNWAQVRGLLDAGWEIGAHTATHCKIAERHAEEGDPGVIREAERPNGIFQERLGFVPDHFAYPSGSRSERTDELLASYYRSLRLWHFEWPIRWTFTGRHTSVLAIDCQNIDLRVSFDDFRRLFAEAQEQR